LRSNILPNKITSEELNMSEVFRLTIRRKYDLKLTILDINSQLVTKTPNHNHNIEIKENKFI